MRQMLIVIALLLAHTAVAGDYEDGMAATERKDYATASTKFRSAAQQGNRVAAYLLGLMYNEGLGVAQDYKEAVRWIQLAAVSGLSDAQFALALKYDKGQGVVQDYKEAVSWYRLAARQGYTNAQFNLGGMYVLGQGVVQDNVRAHMWFNVAAINGDQNSVSNRDKIASRMTPQQIEQAQRMARECMASNFTKCE